MPLDAQTSLQLTSLLSDTPTASLGTLREGAPFVSMVPYAAMPDLTSYIFHISRLAVHTANLLADPRAGLLIIEPGEVGRDPQRLARISIEGQAAPIDVETDGYRSAKAAYLEKYPKAEFNFGLNDFVLFEFELKRARLIAGFGLIVDLLAGDLSQLVNLSD